MQKILLILLGVVILLSLYLFFQDHTSDTNHTSQKTIISEKIEQYTKKEEFTPKIKPSNIVHSPKKKSNQYTIHTIFKEADIDFVALHLKKITDVEPIAAIRMQKEKIKNIKVGESILLPTIDNNEYMIKVVDHHISERGNVSINGSFQENGIIYHAILTEGKASAYITMNTPSGSYEVEVIDGLGFIYSSSDIEQEKIDYTQSDTLQTPKDLK
jgi:hypothetical protein